MKIRYSLVALALAAGLAACDGDDQNREAEHRAGGHYDAEDYHGPAQEVTAHGHDDTHWGTRVVRKPEGVESYCISRNAKGVCTATGTRTKYVTASEQYITDDEDWTLTLADKTVVDVDQETQARYPVGSVYSG